MSIKDFKEVEIAWLAGLLEGEGSFMVKMGNKPPYPRIKLNMTDRDVVEKVALIFQSKVNICTPAVNRKQAFSTTLSKKCRLWDVIDAIYPFMGKRRKTQIDEMRKVRKEREIRWVAKGAWNRGDLQGRSKLREKDVLDIRKSANVPKKELAYKYGISIRTISNIINRDSWRHI